MTSDEVEKRCGRRLRGEFMAEYMRGAERFASSGGRGYVRASNSTLRRAARNWGVALVRDPNDDRVYAVCPICGDQGGPFRCDPVKHGVFYDAFPRGAA